MIRSTVGALGTPNLNWVDVAEQVSQSSTQLRFDRCGVLSICVVYFIFSYGFRRTRIEIEKQVTPEITTTRLLL